MAFVSRQGNPILRLLEPVVFGGAWALVLNLLGWLCHIEYDGKTALIIPKREDRQVCLIT